jgi:hypothetical protein
MDSHHKYLFATSHFSLMSAIYAYKKQNPLWIIPGGVYVNSINYWRNPTFGLRRNIDIGYAVYGVIYQSFVAYSLPVFPKLYFALITLSVASYPISYLFHWKKQYIASTFAHSLIHLFGNIANIALYINM